ncbi:hypothetical protein NUW54_g1074 [Trametes sanguinea]|uniref:Uncharacterized protein n=1 Tax=Trametes sanguinea TaxID=158606 RepID=A0ACC1Q7X7_9APHY|nr:hypothetical protein NUW54_g1074 [Trametes sanguinea]
MLQSQRRPLQCVPREENPAMNNRSATCIASPAYHLCQRHPTRRSPQFYFQHLTTGPVVPSPSTICPRSDAGVLKPHGHLLRGSSSARSPVPPRPTSSISLLNMVAAGLLLLSLLPLALGRPSSESASLVVRSQQKAIPAGFHGIKTSQPAIMKFVLALKPGNTSGLIQSLLDVSDPASSKYGQHLSKAEVDQLVAPPAESVQTVTNWLKNNGIEAETYSSAGDLLRIQIPPEQANTLFNANFSTYVHEKTNTTMVRTLSYSLPADVSEHLAFVYPTTQ